jgi:peptidyl-prolyl cis-trans isomerase D
MLTNFRRFIYSKVGAVIAVIFLGLLALSMTSGDLTSTLGSGGAISGDTVVEVGSASITAPEFRTRIDQEVQAVRQQQPTLDMAQFVGSGGVEGTLERLINGLALQAFGRDQGMVVSKRMIDGEIASIPGLQSLNGQFDPTLFRQLLAERKLTERGVREEVERQLMGQLLTAQFARPVPAPRQLALPYTNLSLERREGEIAFVPGAAVPAGPAPTDAELQTFYQRNRARYLVPERRVVRYARVSADQVRARAAPTETEIAQAYARDRTKYAPSEQRSITQVVVLDRAGADALAAKAKGGQSLTEAARAAGLEASTMVGVDKAALSGRTSAALADAVFGAARGAVVGPVRGGLGFVVARVDAVTQVPGRTLAQARDDIVTALAKQKTADALAELQKAVDDRLADGATFDEVVADQKLSAQTTGALLANGTDPDQPGAPDPALAPIVQAAFQMDDGDEPQLVPAGQDGAFALVALGRVSPAAPRPLAQARDQVARDFAADRARQAARRVAGQILAAVNRGLTFSQAWAATGLNAAPPRPLKASREDVERAQGPTRAPLALMFAIAPGTARLLEEPNGNGWAVIKLNTIIPGDASRDPARVAALQNVFGQVLSRELLQQFVFAARAQAGVKVNQPAVARTKTELQGAQ